MRSTVLDLVGVSCLSLFAFAIWPPAALLPIGVAAIVMAWVSS
jgi:hypothetical protein